MKFKLEDTKAKRIAFNRKSDRKYNWSSTIPWDIFGYEFDVLDMNSDFMSVTEVLQEAVGVEPDGLIGKQTLLAVSDFFRKKSQYWNPYTGNLFPHNEVVSEDKVHFLKWNGLDIPVLLPESVGDVRHHLDLHPTGNFSTKDRVLDSVIVHWGGLDPEHLHRVFSNRSASSHFGIGLDSDGKPYVAQYIDAAHVAWHAKGANDTSLGIDICQQPLLKWLGHYTNRGYDVRVISNPTKGYGPEKVLSLDPRIANLTREFLRTLTFAFDIPHSYAKDHKLAKQPWSGILGHSNVDAKGQGKWDVAPWWNDIQ